MKYGGVQRIVLLALIISGCGKVSGADAGETRNTGVVENSTASTSLIAGRASTPSVSDQGSENDAINKRTMTALRTNLIGHATLDDEPIVNLVAQGSCASALITAKARKNIDWSRVGNLAPETVNGRDVTAIITADGPIKVAVPSGDIADRITMGMGLLAENCEVRPDHS
ncbi:hypothetical protein [Sphingomonas yabuuchiae]|uniref:hypothetical protein n=1 Tax=Sphingomonas yabuuchiae TaxID=172044 RepID=UPI003D9738E7